MTFRISLLNDKNVKQVKIIHIIIHIIVCKNINYPYFTQIDKKKALQEKCCTSFNIIKSISIFKQLFRI